MALSFVIGNLIGRALVSYLLVWIVCLATSKFNWRVAFARSKRWYAVVAVVAMTLAGMGAAISNGGGLA